MTQSKSVQVDTPFDDLDIFSEPAELENILSEGDELDFKATPCTSANSDASLHSSTGCVAYRCPISSKKPRVFHRHTSLSSRFWVVSQGPLLPVSPSRSPRVLRPRDGDAATDPERRIKARQPRSSPGIPIDGATGQVEPAPAASDARPDSDRALPSLADPGGCETAPDGPARTRPPSAKMHPPLARVSRRPSPSSSAS